MNLKINLAGTFEGKLLNEKVEVTLPSASNMKILLESLNKKYQISAFSPRNIKKNLIVVLVNGERLNPEDMKKIIQEENVISILQPIMGG